VSDDTRLRAGALRRIAVAREGGGHYGQVYSAAREAELLSWAATVPDEDILGWRNTGPGYLRWIRDHQPHWHRNLWPETLALVEGVLKWYRMPQLVALPRPTGCRGLSRQGRGREDGVNRHGISQNPTAHDRAISERSRATRAEAELERLRAENKRLQAALAKAEAERTE